MVGDESGDDKRSVRPDVKQGAPRNRALIRRRRLCIRSDRAVVITRQQEGVSFIRHRPRRWSGASSATPPRAGATMARRRSTPPASPPAGPIRCTREAPRAKMRTYCNRRQCGPIAGAVRRVSYPDRGPGRRRGASRVLPPDDGFRAATDSACFPARRHQGRHRRKEDGREGLERHRVGMHDSMAMSCHRRDQEVSHEHDMSPREKRF